MAAWPVVADLEEWVRASSVSPSSSDMLGLSFDAASELLRDRIDAAVLKKKAAAAGIETDEDAAGYDAAVLAAWCPSYVHQAILIRAAALYTRRDSQNGTISFGEFATSIRSQDPDVEDMMSAVMGPAVA